MHAFLGMLPFWFLLAPRERPLEYFLENSCTPIKFLQRFLTNQKECSGIYYGCIRIGSMCQICIPNMPSFIMVLFARQYLFFSQGHKVIPLDVIWKGIFSVVCMLNMKSHDSKVVAKFRDDNSRTWQNKMSHDMIWGYKNYGTMWKI